MKAIIPVAGFGTRMRPHTLTHPKVLLPVANKPMIAHIVEKLLEDGVDELVFVVGHLGEEIEKYIRETFPVKSHFLEQTEFLGLGHAIYTAREFLAEEPVIIVLGDTIYDVKLKEVLHGKHHSLGVKIVENPARFGVAVLDEKNFITKLVEKPKKPVSNLALVGLYFLTNGTVLEKALAELIARNIRTKNEYQLTDALQVMIEHGEKITTFPVEGWYDCGKPETLLETNGIILQRDFGDADYSFENSVIIPPVYIPPDAKIRNAIIGPNVTVGKECRIENAIVKNTILGSGTVIQQISLHDSLIGDFAEVKGKSKNVNLGDYSQLDFE